MTEEKIAVLVEKWGFTDSEWRLQAIDAIREAVALARKEAIEQAAMVADECPTFTGDVCEDACRRIASRIRALGEEVKQI